MKLTSYLYLLVKLRLHGAVSPSPKISSWHDAELSMRYIFVVWFFVKHRDNFSHIQYGTVRDTYLSFLIAFWRLYQYNIEHCPVCEEYLLYMTFQESALFLSLDYWWWWLY